MSTKITSQHAGTAINASRRKFLTKVGGVAAFSAIAAACQKSVSPSSALNASSTDSANADKGFGTGDVAILNYAFFLEQLEAAFYMMVTENLYSGCTAWEKARLMQIRDHEIAHREFFKTALGKNGIGDKEFDFSSIDFSSRASVLGAAQTFEDTGVSAYNGVAYRIQNPDYLTVAGKIVSVEARHASYIRELVMLNSFADSAVVDFAGLDLFNSPKVVLEAVKPYVKTKMNFNGL